MKNVNHSFCEQKMHFRIFAFLFIIMLCLISFDALYAQPGKSQKPKKLRINGKTIMHIERSQDLTESNCVRLPNRTVDGTCNNISDMTTSTWGAADIQLFRTMYPAYGMPDHYNDMAGNCRISPRAISNLVVSQLDDMPSPRGLSSLVFTWGQFIDHDMDLTPEGHDEYVPVLLPSSEPLFTSPIPFFRSEEMDGTGIDNPREQQNIITSWIDASNVYGSEQTRSDWLRTFSQGKLKMSDGNLLPYNTIDGNQNSTIDSNAPSMAGDGDGTVVVFVAGDVRANEQPGLTSLHTLFVREHNRICNHLVSQGMNNDEQIYQRARKQVGAIIQAITYEEFLPALGIHVPQWSGYDPSAKPDVTNMFASAAYRLGHTMVTNEIPLLGTNCSPISGGSLALLDGFFNPAVIQEHGITPFLQGLSSQIQQKVDTKIVDNLRNFLFPAQGGGPAFGLDLASLNIQRGRDHGLPDYNSVRAYYTGNAASDFSDITSDSELIDSLEIAYGSVYDMDLWVGLLAEDHLPGSSIGMTLNAILGKQFSVLRDGDFYFYRNDPAFSSHERDKIRNTSLHDVIMKNTDIDKLQDNVFFAKDCNQNSGGSGHGNGPGNGPGHGHGNGHGLVQSPQTLYVYPNPSKGNINVRLLFNDFHEEVSITIRNLNGLEIYQANVPVTDNSINHQMSLRDVPTGIYFIKVQSKNEIFSKKLILE